jgi:hypothetical protein
MPSHELDNAAWLDEQAANTSEEQPSYTRRSSLSPKASWPAADPTEARLIAERVAGTAPASQQVPPHEQLLRLAKKAFPDLTLRPGMYCDVNQISGTSCWHFALRASGMPLGAEKPQATGDTPDACIEALIKKVAPIRRQVIAAREASQRSRHQNAA